MLPFLFSPTPHSFLHMHALLPPQVDAGHKQAVRDIKSTVAQQSKRGAEEEEEILGMIKNALESTNAEVKKLTRKFLSTA